MHHDRSLGIPPKLGIQRPQGAHEPVVVLEVAVRGIGLRAGEEASDKEEVARRVVDSEFRGGAARGGKSLRVKYWGSVGMK